MEKSFSEVKLFQVKPDKLIEFETLITKIADEQKQQMGCIDIKYVKRFYTIDEITAKQQDGFSKIISRIFKSC